MAEVEGQEKTEQATPKKLADGRKKGQVAKSQEINSLAIFSSGLIVVYATQQLLSGKLASFSKEIFNTLDVLEISKSNLQQIFQDWMIFAITVLAPVFIAVFVVALVAGIAQVGWKFSFQVFIPDLKRFNPLAGIKRIFFNSRSYVELFKSILKFIVIGLFTYLVIEDFIEESAGLLNFTILEIVTYMLEASFSLIWKIALVYAVLAAIDFVFQKYKFKQEMMMTKQEVKEENKQAEGDPQIKSRIRKVQMQLSTNRMIQEVSKADVVITNPTHFAVALKYDMQKDSAPKVVAKGMDLLAQKIKAVAAENNVPLHEDRELARALYKYCEVGDRIPEALFKAVAQILAYVYQLKKRKKKNIV